VSQTKEPSVSVCFLSALRVRSLVLARLAPSFSRCMYIACNTSPQIRWQTGRPKNHRDMYSTVQYTWLLAHKQKKRRKHPSRFGGRVLGEVGSTRCLPITPSLDSMICRTVRLYVWRVSSAPHLLLLLLLLLPLLLPSLLTLWARHVPAIGQTNNVAYKVRRACHMTLS